MRVVGILLGTNSKAIIFCVEHISFLLILKGQRREHWGSQLMSNRSSFDAGKGLFCFIRLIVILCTGTYISFLKNHLQLSVLPAGSQSLIPLMVCEAQFRGTTESVYIIL